MKAFFYSIVIFILPITICHGQHLSGGYFHSLYTCSDSSLIVVGSNEYGQLGTNQGAQISLPKPIYGISEIAEISSGSNHNLALSYSGKVFSWGYNENNELGRNITSYDATITQLGLSNIIEVIAGDNFSLALRNDGSLFVWGKNNSGQLGNKNAPIINVPKKLSSIIGVKKIAAGQTHILALKYDGTVWSLGNSFQGKLGDGILTNSINTTPQQLIVVSNVIDIAVGAYHSVILKENGTVWTTGYNYYGTLGDGSFTSSSTFKQVTTLSSIVSIKSGQNHVLALKNDGTIYTWGMNQYGQLGNGTFAKKSIPEKIGLSNIIEIGVGKYHSMALSSTGELYTWGLNNKNQLGNETLSNQNIPTLINIPCTISTSNVICTSNSTFLLESDTLCQNEKLETVATDTTAYEYQWFLNDSLIGEKVALSQFISSSGTNKISLITNLHGCADTLESSLFIKNNPTSDFTYSIQNNSVIELSNTSINGSKYEWYVDKKLYSNSFETSYTTNVNSIFSIDLVAVNSCSKDTSSQEINFNQLGFSKEEFKYTVYPNPVINKLSIQIPYKTPFFTQIQIYNSEGKMVYKQFISNTNTTIDLSHLISGYYYGLINKESMPLPFFFIKL